MEDTRSCDSEDRGTLGTRSRDREEGGTLDCVTGSEGHKGCHIQHFVHPLLLSSSLCWGAGLDQ